VEGGDEQGRHSTLVGRCVVRDLPPDLPKATPVEVIFNYTQDGRLLVLAQLPTINRKANLTIERSSGLTESELIYWKNRIDAGIMTSDVEQAAETGLPSSQSFVKEPSIGVPEPPRFVPDKDDAAIAAVFPSAEGDHSGAEDTALISETADLSPDNQESRSEESKAKSGGWKSRRQQVKAGDN